MPASRSASLRRRFPRRIDVPFLLILSAALLAGGLTLPAIETQTLLFWHDEHSILLNIQQLSKDGKETAALILTVCSIAYPGAKLALLTFFWLFPFPATWRWRSIQLIRLLGRWGMVDVIAISSIVLASLTVGPLEATPKLGLYLFALGILCLMFTGLLMDRMARCGRA
jgi:uncharacterized paraquat-inducible protein A